ncbi:sulfatase [Algoriphagus halophytocola]|uniref:Sulfatase n=1 Tax=Algoriphagus halophytocola TaxID=2991499 RepID=A0ABY6MGG2_9BACT|nr:MULTISPECIES: sulfatase [unclassified Algoriphagus]UZD22064.1 sulfatase [Algoriphagus sp. TR-M5]WBL43315.1 sulfatase [Algoriphagus sp. TR-M9]
MLASPFLVVLLSLFHILHGPAPKADQPNVLFLIADDWSFPHAGVYGDPVVRTPTFDRLAAEGALFTNAYTASPSCSPSRAAVLLGRYPHQNKDGGNLWSEFPAQYPTYVSLLEKAGYFTGSTRKGWGPGDFKISGMEHNPAGKSYEDFKTFLAEKPAEQAFTFWFGSTDPHRVYVPNTGIQAGMPLTGVRVPGFFPDNDCVRNDILDYYFEVERFDRECGQLIKMLEEAGELDNTIIVMTSDNGMPFPRAKANLYDYGTRMPLVIRWPEKVKAGTVIDDFVNFVDFAPSFLEAAGLSPENMSGQSLWPLLAGEKQDRDQVYLERERHANVRKGDLSYPMRAVRDHQFLYIRNMMPERNPAGDPSVHQSVGQFGDVDNSITKFLIMNLQGKAEAGGTDYFELAFGSRPAEELYDVVADPYQLNNLAEDKSYASVKAEMKEKLQKWMEETHDLRATDPRSTYWDEVRYTPEYQLKNFDFQKGIEEYTIKPPFGKYAKAGIPCLDAE